MTATGLGFVCHSVPDGLAALVAGPAGRAREEFATRPTDECEKFGPIIKAMGARIG